MLPPKPMIFSAPMVLALKRRAKSVTRRLVTTREPWADFVSVGRGRPIFDPRIEHHRELMAQACPYGYQAGQRLYVRENLVERDDGWHYAADDAPVLLDTASPLYLSAVSWVHHKEAEHCPSIHMPRFASRFTLELTEPVRVERLIEITDDEARLEGITRGPDGWWDGAEHPVKGSPKAMPTPREAFVSLWDELNYDRCAFARAPWVFRIGFRVVEGPTTTIDAPPAQPVQEATP